MSGSDMPQRGPRAKRLSYSMRTPSLPLPFLPLPSRDTRIRSQPMVQLAQPALRCRWLRCSSSPLTCSAPSKVDSRKLRVGSVPSRLNTATLAMVPRLRYFSVAAPRLRRLNSRPKLRTFSGSATSTGWRPLIATASRFLAPITAPKPQRPACRPPSLLMEANLTCASPAGPIQATR